MSIEQTKQAIIHAYQDYDSRYGGWGWCTLNKAGCIIDYVNEICSRVENPVCVEIGVYGGKSILPVALELKRHGKGIVHAIDPWSNEEATKGYDDLNHEFWNNVDLNRILNIFRASITEFKLEHIVDVVRSTSDDAPVYHDIDLLYIDGQHTEQALKDVKKYAVNVKEGGYCLVDDINWGEVKAVPFYLESLGFYEIHSVDDAKIYRRKFIESIHSPMKFDWVDDSIIKYTEYPGNFDWADLTFPQVYQIQREVIKEKVYRWFRDVKEGDVVVDLGASVGAYAITIFDQKPKRVICVEPNKSFAKSIYKNCSTLALENNVNFSVVTNAILTNGQSKTGMIEDVECTYQSFADFVKENNLDKINILKMDIEGGEYEVLADENIEYLINNVEFITLELHLKGNRNENHDNRKKFIEFRDKHLNKFKSYKLYGDAVNGNNKHQDFTEFIFDNNFIENYQRELMLYLDNGNNIKAKKSVEVNYNFSLQQKNSCWIVDNFYEDPDSVREFALKQDYHIGGIGRGYIGNRTHEQFLFPGLKERFESIMGKKITHWEEHGMNGRFQWCVSGQPQVWHCDSQQWGGMLYLSPDAPYQYGTSLYAHKQTRARTYYDTGWDAAWTGVPGDSHLDGSDWEPVDVLGNVYNRLVIFDASCIHSSSGYFGTVKENCRLWQMFFFDAS